MDRLSWLVRATKYTASRQGKVVLCHVRSCVNIATKICEDVLAVAQKKEMLDEFITTFNKKRRACINDGYGRERWKQRNESHQEENELMLTQSQSKDTFIC